jgi:hypothetical protein
MLGSPEDEECYGRDDGIEVGMGLILVKQKSSSVRVCVGRRIGGGYHWMNVVSVGERAGCESRTHVI